MLFEFHFVPSFAKGVENVAFSDARIPSHKVAEVILKRWLRSTEKYLDK